LKKVPPGGGSGPPPPTPTKDVVFATNTQLSLPKDDGWEPNAASSGKAVFFTTNFQNAFSTDAGLTFATVDPYSYMSAVPGGFCCDQAVQYIPSIDRFVWVAQSNVTSSNENEYRIGVASPSDLTSSNGTKWTAFDVKSHDLAGNGKWFDYPEIAYDENYLFLSFNVVGAKAMVARVALSSLAGTTPFRVDYASVNGWFVRPIQNTSHRGLFVVQVYTNSAASVITLNVLSWEDSDPASKIVVHQVDGRWPVSSDFSTSTPLVSDWLSPITKISGHIYGATQSKNSLYIAWNNGRIKPILPYPYVQVSILNATTFVPTGTEAIYNNNYAIVYPALATSLAGDVGVSLMFGGGAVEPAFAVGLRLAANNWQIAAATSPPGYGGGGHYLGIRPIAKTRCFAAAGYVAIPDPTNVPFGYSNQSHYVEFVRGSASQCP